MINLQVMNAEQFDESKPLMIEDYAQAIAQNERIPIADARQRSADQTNSLLSQGVSTPNHTVYNILLEDGPQITPIGILWVEVNPERQRCFIFNIYLHEQFRGQGYGRQTLESLEASLNEQGISRIGLHVFAGNTTARRLYEKLGYQVVSLNMEKQLAK